MKLRLTLPLLWRLIDIRAQPHALHAATHLYQAKGSPAADRLQDRLTTLLCQSFQCGWPQCRLCPSCPILDNGQAQERSLRAMISHLQQRSHAAAREHMDDRPPAVWPANFRRPKERTWKLTSQEE